MTARYLNVTCGFFAGSFNPFTKGHKAIVDTALKFLDTVVIGIGANIEKPDSLQSAKTRSRVIEDIFKDEPRIKVIVYSTLTVEAAKEMGATVLIRGLRNASDFDYEKSLADANLRLGGIETVMLPSNPELSWISSTLVRDLQKRGLDVSEMLP